VSLSRPWIFVLFCLAAAFIAAAVADPFVEALSNSGVFGTARYTDRSTIDVLPVLAVGVAGAMAWTLIQVRKLLGVAPARSDWLQRSARAIDGRCVLTMYPVIFALQIVILFFMETVEQMAVYGHVIGPLIWLGGPVAISLAAHAIVCLAASFVLHRILYRCASAITVIARFVARLFSVLAADATGTFTVALQFVPGSTTSPLHCRIGERAPPLSA